MRIRHQVFIAALFSTLLTFACRREAPVGAVHQTASQPVDSNLVV